MATKFETLKGKWITTDEESEKQLINLDSYSKIYQSSEFNGENMEYQIAFVKADSIPEFCFEYNNPEEWNTDFEDLKDLLNQNHEIQIL